MEAIPKTEQNPEFASSLNRIGEALIAQSKLKNEDVERILALQQKKNILFGEAAIELGLLKQKDIFRVLSEQYEYAYSFDAAQVNAGLIAAHMPFSEEAEQLRSLRGQLQLAWFNQGHKSLAITSSCLEDGASRLAANLAIVFSQLNKKTLLMDANLREPNQQNLFDVKSRLGLSNILANRQGNYQLARHPSLPYLSILTAGTAVPNPQELLSKQNFSELLSDLEQVYDIILVDTSPMNLGADYLHVVSNIGSALVVSRRHHTKAADLVQLDGQLRMTSAHLVGSVLQEF